MKESKRNNGENSDNINKEFPEVNILRKPVFRPGLKKGGGTGWLGQDKKERWAYSIG